MSSAEPEAEPNLGMEREEARVTKGTAGFSAALDVLTEVGAL